jgi:hypothetical protein
VFGVAALLIMAAILPPALDDWQRKSTGAAELPLPEVAREYGLLESEKATYANGNREFEIALHRLRDVTGAVALEQSLQSPSRKVFRHQNYVFETLQGTAPRAVLDAFLLPTLKADRSSAPTITGYLPRQGRLAGSERLVLGPASLKAFEPRIPVAAAGFDYEAEVQLARYPGAVLAVIAYPNHAIARQQTAQLKDIPQGALKRSGPIVALVLPEDPAKPLSPETAQALASQIEYKATVVLDKAPGKPEPNPGDLILGAFKLVGILLVICLGLGIIFALGRTYWNSWTGKKEDDEMTTLGI